MGYACPVCDVPQRDAEHLANHLAFTALLRHDAHEVWLDEQLPGWGEEGPDELADRVVDHAEAADYDEVFEDTAKAGHSHEGVAHGRAERDARPDRALDDDAASVIDEARAYTREMYGLDEDGSEGSGEGDDANEGDDG
jgi:hypothetical protein